MTNPYEVLGVSPNANEEEIKKAYRQKAFDLHPDRGGSPDQFKQVQSAYEQITKPQQPKFSHQNVDPFSDIFNSFFSSGFGGFHQQKQPERGKDIYGECSVEFMEAAMGCEKIVKLRKGESCQTCKGSGAAHDGMVNCHACGGHGVISMRQGNFHIQQTCKTCGGKGHKIIKMCADCSGDGIVKDTTEINVKIPAGIGDGDTIRLPGLGEQKNNRAGDAYVTIHVKSHPLFKRFHDNLVIIVPVSYVEAVLGGQVNVPMLDGTKEITISPGTKSGTEIVFGGLGLTNPQTGRRGDFVIKLEIDVSMPDKEACKTLKKYEKAAGISEVRKTFEEKVKEMKII